MHPINRTNKASDISYIIYYAMLLICIGIELTRDSLCQVVQKEEANKSLDLRHEPLLSLESSYTENKTTKYTRTKTDNQQKQGKRRILKRDKQGKFVEMIVNSNDETGQILLDPSGVLPEHQSMNDSGPTTIQVHPIELDYSDINQPSLIQVQAIGNRELIGQNTTEQNQMQLNDVERLVRAQVELAAKNWVNPIEQTLGLSSTRAPTMSIEASVQANATNESNGDNPSRFYPNHNYQFDSNSSSPFWQFHFKPTEEPQMSEAKRTTQGDLLTASSSDNESMNKENNNNSPLIEHPLNDISTSQQGSGSPIIDLSKLSPDSLLQLQTMLKQRPSTAISSKSSPISSTTPTPNRQRQPIVLDLSKRPYVIKGWPVELINDHSPKKDPLPTNNLNDQIQSLIDSQQELANSGGSKLDLGNELLSLAKSRQTNGSQQATLSLKKDATGNQQTKYLLKSASIQPATDHQAKARSSLTSPTPKLTTLRIPTTSLATIRPTLIYARPQSQVSLTNLSGSSLLRMDPFNAVQRPAHHHHHHSHVHSIRPAVISIPIPAFRPKYDPYDGMMAAAAAAAAAATASATIAKSRLPNSAPPLASPATPHLTIKAQGQSRKATNGIPIGGTLNSAKQQGASKLQHRARAANSPGTIATYQTSLLTNLIESANKALKQVAGNTANLLGGQSTSSSASSAQHDMSHVTASHRGSSIESSLDASDNELESVGLYQAPMIEESSNSALDAYLSTLLTSASQSVPSEHRAPPSDDFRASQMESVTDWSGHSTGEHLESNSSRIPDQLLYSNLLLGGHLNPKNRLVSSVKTSGHISPSHGDLKSVQGSRFMANNKADQQQLDERQLSFKVKQFLDESDKMQYALAHYIDHQPANLKLGIGETNSQRKNQQSKLLYDMINDNHIASPSGYQSQLGILSLGDSSPASSQTSSKLKIKQTSGSGNSKLATDSSSESFESQLLKALALLTTETQPQNKRNQQTSGKRLTSGLSNTGLATSQEQTLDELLAATAAGLGSTPVGSASLPAKQTLTLHQYPGVREADQTTLLLGHGGHLSPSNDLLSLGRQRLLEHYITHHLPEASSSEVHVSKARHKDMMSSESARLAFSMGHKGTWILIHYWPLVLALLPLMVITAILVQLIMSAPLVLFAMTTLTVSRFVSAIFGPVRSRDSLGRDDLRDGQPSGVSLLSMLKPMIGTNLNNSTVRPNSRRLSTKRHRRSLETSMNDWRNPILHEINDEFGSLDDYIESLSVKLGI